MNIGIRVFLSVGIVFVVLLQYRYWFGDAGYFEAKSLAARIEKQTRVNHRLLQRNRVLASEVNVLRDGLDAVESRARTDLGMISEGETFYMVVSSKLETNTEPVSRERPEEN